MTKEEEKLACLKLSIHFGCDKLDGKDGEEERLRFIDSIKTFDGKNEYTLRFFPNGDSDILKYFPNTIKNPSELDESLDGFDDISSRTWIECCCYGAWGIYEKLNK